ncbi:MAG: class I SAM-dependent methyltransferase, partial [Steroidobacteraceae bacterium]
MTTTRNAQSEQAAYGAFSDISSDSAGKRREFSQPPPAATGVPWQLQMYAKSLKKRQKVDLLLRLLGSIRDQRCLLVSGHDNNGAMNHHFRAAGGRWSWGQVYPQGIAEMAEFLGDPVAHVDINRFPFPDDAFDVVIIIDVHEHFSDVGGL